MKRWRISITDLIGKNKQHKRRMAWDMILHSQIPLEISCINPVLCHDEFSRACSEDIIKQPAIVETAKLTSVNSHGR